MLVGDTHYRTIWLKPGTEDSSRPIVQIIDQRYLPHRFVIEDLQTAADVACAIRDMHLRGAGLIGAAAGYGMLLAAAEAPPSEFESYIQAKAAELRLTRPTAVNLSWALDRMIDSLGCASSPEDRLETARRIAEEIADEDADCCRRIGLHGVELIKDIHDRTGRRVQILTHCNAGWLAFVDHGSATAPIYEAANRGIPLHVWVDETRPRNQGAKLTAWELLNQGIPHTVIADNTGGHLMQHGMVDLVIVGSDRTTATGDVANKIGTYLKALAAQDNRVPFYVALPSSTFDWSLTDGISGIPIEQRDQDEVKFVDGLINGEIGAVRITPEGSACANFGFDVTPARLVSGLITERGICSATKHGIAGLFSDKVSDPKSAAK